MAYNTLLFIMKNDQNKWNNNTIINCCRLILDGYIILQMFSLYS